MVLLVVDVQTGITNDTLYEFSVFKKALGELLRAARAHGIEVVYVRHDDGPECALTKGKPEFEIAEEFQPQAGERIFGKQMNSPFKASGLLEYLQGKGETQLIVAGLQTDYCIDATVKCGFEHGFSLLVPMEANTTTDNSFMTGEKSHRYYNGFIWKNRYADCMPLAQLLAAIAE